MEKRKEHALRRKLSKVGLALRKSRAKTINGNDFGGYMVIERKSNTVVSGNRFDLSLQQQVETITNL